MLANWRTDAAQKRRQEQPRRPLQIAAEIRAEAQLKIKEKTTNLFKGGRFNEEVDGSNSQIKLGSETTHGQRTRSSSLMAVPALADAKARDLAV